MARIDLTGKPIVITGASSGIGEATALACARAGMPVVVGARRLDRLTNLVERIRADGGKAQAMVCDVTKPQDCAALVAMCVEKFGSVYAVYANAGYGMEASALETTDEQYRHIFETNFFGTLNTVRPAVAQMRQARTRGHVIICSSCLAKATVPYYGAYSATKAAQAHIGRAMRLELEPEGIAVSVVCPIGTKTEFFEAMHDVGKVSDVEHTPESLKQTPAFVAERIVKCLHRPRAEVWTGFKGWFVRFGMSVLTLAPGLADTSTRGMVKRREASLRPKH
jgi:short-subunit dehydrogenase